MSPARPLRIGITCYPTVGGSGILASALGVQLAERGHEIHFISYGRPFRLPRKHPRIYFHQVEINTYDLFKYPDYTLPLSVKMAEVSRTYSLDILHVHYAVPHATAAILARGMLGSSTPKIVTTLHGTDTTLLGSDPGYGPAIRYALECSDAVTAVSAYLRDETRRLLGITRQIDVIHNFFEPVAPTRSQKVVRNDLGISSEDILLVHMSNLRPLKRIDILLRAVGMVQPRSNLKLLVLAGGDFTPFRPIVEELNLNSTIIVRDNIFEIEDYLQCSDIGIFTSESESFCLSILEAMCFACPSVSTAVGGIPELIESGVTGILTPTGNPHYIAKAIEALLENPTQRKEMGLAGQATARRVFSASAIIPQYESLYCGLIDR